MTNPPAEVRSHNGYTVVRDDLYVGGTKARVLPRLMDAVKAGREVVYASPGYGYAQVALAVAARFTDRQAVIFTAQRKVPHPRTVEAQAHSARIVMVPNGYLSHVTKRARDYCADTGATLLPFGLDHPAMREGLVAEAHRLSLTPTEVWSVAGSGTLSRALQDAWPRAAFHAVQVGRVPDVGYATLYQSPEKFEQRAAIPPPFPSNDNYDAKAWRFMQLYASPGALFWNVA